MLCHPSGVKGATAATVLVVESERRRVLSVPLSSALASRLAEGDQALDPKALPIRQAHADEMFRLSPTELPFRLVWQRHFQQGRVLLRLAGCGGALAPAGQPPAPGGGATAAERTLLLAERRVVEKACEAFRSELDPVALAASEQPGALPSLGLYNWLQAASGLRRRRRLQALQGYPLLISALVRQADSDAAGTLGAAVDRGEPLVDALAELYRVPKGFIRRHRGPGGPRLRRMVGSVPALARWLALLPADALPAERAEWEALRELVDQLHSLEATWPAERRVLEKAARRFLSECARRGWTAAWRRFRDGFANTAGFEDLQDLVRQAEWLYGAEAFAPVAARLLAQGVEQVQRVSERWHWQPAEVADDAAALSVLRWPALMPELELAGRRLLPLCSAAELKEEGRRLRHCVGGYSEQCLFRSVHIVSIRDRLGPRSTVELELVRQGAIWKIEVRQHRGEANSAPDPACVQALEALLEHLAAPGAVDFAALERERERRCADRKRQTLALRRGMSGAATEAMRRALPQELFARLSAGEEIGCC